MGDRIAIVTGAGRGIGRATAVELSARGFQLALVSRSADELSATAGMCKTKAKPFICDVSDPASVDQMIEAVLNSFGGVNALVHCAGFVVMRAIDALTVEEWRSILDTNLSSVFYLCRRLWPVWRDNGGGVIVNVSSQAARDPFAGLSAYGAAKAGVNLLGLALSREGAKIGVRVHTVAPAATETAMLRSIISKEQVPTENALDPAAVARVIVQCVSGDLDCTSGEVIYVRKYA